MKRCNVRHPRKPIAWMPSPSGKPKHKPKKHQHQEKKKLLTLPVRLPIPETSKEIRDKDGFYILRKKGEDGHD